MVALPDTDLKRGRDVLGILVWWGHRETGRRAQSVISHCPAPEVEQNKEKRREEKRREKKERESKSRAVKFVDLAFSFLLSFLISSRGRRRTIRGDETTTAQWAPHSPTSISGRIGSCDKGEERGNGLIGSATWQPDALTDASNEMKTKISRRFLKNQNQNIWVHVPIPNPFYSRTDCTGKRLQRLHHTNTPS
ncbi:hypothetical protein PanWU01x14_211100 [Parasponia andersonii]|uniref:Uncharacterized protein n=1 Tax=Parasponia andersonii TaxID=3476 RepID=A0A2P5BTM9_PARAD|nr:hypothetical protein PanWU01x14_211100 [Parasponia andersonii]